MRRASWCDSWRELGYTVLEADDGRGARSSSSTRGEPIDLLFTDVVMPGGMSGLRSRARSARAPAGPEGAVHLRLPQAR